MHKVSEPSPAQPLQNELLYEVVRIVEATMMRNGRAILTPEKKGRVVAMLYAHCLSLGKLRPSPELVREFINLAS